MKNMTPEQIRARYDAKEAEKAKKRLEKAQKKVKRFENRFIKPRLLRKGSVQLRNRELKRIGLKLNDYSTGKHGETEQYLDCIIDRARWNTPHEIMEWFQMILKNYMGLYHVEGIYGKDGHLDRLSIYPRSKH